MGFKSKPGIDETTSILNKATDPNSSDDINGKDPSTSAAMSNNDSLRASTSSLLLDLQLHSTEIGEISEMSNYETLSTSAVLRYCKYKILKPYLRLLGVMGLSPAKRDEAAFFTCRCFCTNFHTLQVMLLVCLGYVLQYMACFRRDRGYCYKKMPLQYEAKRNGTGPQVYNPMCYGNIVLSYLIPSLLHLVSYLYTVYLFRIKENEQLQNLMERAFLLSSNPVNRGSQRRLVKILWFFIGLGIIWMTMALYTVVAFSLEENVHFHWIIDRSHEVKVAFKVLLIICTLWHDMIQGTIITSYCLQGQLLISHLFSLRAKLTQHTLPLLDWMKEISEFNKLLTYFNEEFGPAVCIYTIVNITWASASSIWLVISLYENDFNLTEKLTHVSIINALLWISISIVPFIQASRLTAACCMIQNVGHEVRIRPYVYQGTPGEDLDTILLYTSSLNMYASLYAVPISGRYLCLLITIVGITVLTLGQFRFLS